MPLVRTQYIPSVCNLLPDSLPAPAGRSLAIHREEIRYVLIDLFENPIADADSESRELLSAVLVKPNLEFAKPILDLADNPHLYDGDRYVPWSGQVYRPACGRTGFCAKRACALS
jgi:hypothetical protein